MRKLNEMSVLSRTVVLWVGFMAVLWTIFAIGLVTHPQAWIDVPPVMPERGWTVFWSIIVNNFLILILISIGNLFVRFGSITPGLVILGIQAITIGWTAGTNGFIEPFQSVTAANAAFLRIALWETTGYVVICAVTLSKSLLVSDTFPAKKWVKSTSIKELKFTRLEIGIALLGLFALIGAAAIEAF